MAKEFKGQTSVGGWELANLIELEKSRADVLHARVALARLIGSCGSLRDHDRHDSCPGHTTSVVRMREQLRADRWKKGQPPPVPITKDSALAYLRRYRNRYPSVPAEVAAVELIRRIDSWEEITAILASLGELVREEAVRV